MGNFEKKSKRSNGEGSVFQRKDGIWVYQISIRDDDGLPTTKSFTGKSRAAVVKKKKEYDKRQTNLETLHKDMSRFDVRRVDQSTSLSQWVYEWIELYKKPPNVKETTYASYLNILYTHIKPFFGNTPLSSVSTDDMQLFYNHLSEKGRIDGKPGGLSPKTIRNIHNMLHSSLETAVGKVLPYNPSSSTTRPSVPIPEMRVLSGEEMGRFLQEAEQENLFAAIVVSLFTGIRLGELLALEWSDIDFKKGTLRIQKNWERVRVFGDDARKTKLILQDTPKSKKSNRVIPLTKEVIQVLYMEKEKQKWEEKKAFEKTGAHGTTNPYGYVFKTKKGTRIDPRNFEKVVKRICERSDIYGCSVHTLRHTFATRLSENNVPLRVVQDLMGHASLNTTMRYTHALEEKKREAVETMTQFKLLQNY